MSEPTKPTRQNTIYGALWSRQQPKQPEAQPEPEDTAESTAEATTPEAEVEKVPVIPVSIWTPTESMPTMPTGRGIRR